MGEFVEQEMDGARFERVSMTGAALRRVDLSGSTFEAVDLTEADIRIAVFNGAKMRGVEMVDVEISGEIENVTVNGVEIGALIEAELNRRTPERAKMRPDDPEGFREAWSILTRLWAATVERARQLPPEALHVRVGGEWSFIDTLRHLNFASAAWVGRMILGEPSPWHPLDLAWEQAPGWDGIPSDREAKPALDDVLAVRHDRQAMVGRVIEALTDEQLTSTVTQMEPGWPKIENFPLSECLRTVLTEEWEHRTYAERDLDRLITASSD